MRVCTERNRGSLTVAKACLTELAVNFFRNVQNVSMICQFAPWDLECSVERAARRQAQILWIVMLCK